jgi:hypothetical protein
MFTPFQHIFHLPLESGYTVHDTFQDKIKAYPFLMCFFIFPRRDEGGGEENTVCLEFKLLNIEGFSFIHRHNIFI